MGYYSQVSGDVCFIDDAIATSADKEFREICDDANISDTWCNIDGYNSSLYNSIDEILQKYNDKIVECTVYGEGEDGSRWRWRKRPGWERVKEEQGYTVYEGDDIEEVKKYIGL